ncbi:putative periplasmic lipoprotein [Wenzhouxiangella sp. EGI_FJ10305]|uniref:hypothetical protein n=1 Tax=Wenzhouxiangella sp. EGI_FJ10305 TaxID=3243768 RepID=UPI0035DE853C
MARRLIALSLAVFLAACATRPADVVTVHIFSNQPDHPEVIALGEQLEAAGYRHRITYAETPGGLEVAETVIVHGDSTSAFNRAQELEALFAAPGDSIRIEREGYGNHHFTAGNLGIYIHLPDSDRKPQLKVRAHLAGTCEGRPLELFLRVDRSYRLERQRWEDDYTLVDAGNERGDWAPSGAGYAMTTSGDAEWSLEPPLDTDPAVNVYFVSGHPDFGGCRLAEPL